MEQAEAEVVPSSSLVEVGVKVEVGVEVEVWVEVKVKVEVNVEWKTLAANSKINLTQLGLYCHQGT